MQKKNLAVFIVCYIYAFSNLTEAKLTYSPNLVTQLTIDKPGFTSFIPSGYGAGNGYHLAVSSFNGAPFSADFAYYIGNFSLTGQNQIKRLDNTKLHWPNEISYTRESLLGPQLDRYGGLLVAGGFLVPSKTNGALYYYPFNSQDRSSVSSDKPILLTEQGSQEWFYHRAMVLDLNGEGTNDILTCRTYKPIVGSANTELVALIYNQITNKYDENVILNNACDVFFDVTDLNNDGRFEIVAAGFFISKLSVVYSDDPQNSFVNGNVHVINIDTEGGEFFDVEVVDLDLDPDNKKELLVTNHQGNKAAVKGSLFYYKLDGEFKTGKWTRTTIYNDFPVLKKGLNQAAPGSAKVFWPNLKEKGTRPYILVAGDGAEKAYVFEPNDDSPLAYNLTWSNHYKGFTVGGTSIADVDGDGYSEVIIPTYEANICYVYSFKPQN